MTPVPLAHWAWAGLCWWDTSGNASLLHGVLGSWAGPAHRNVLITNTPFSLLAIITINSSSPLPSSTRAHPQHKSHWQRKQKHQECICAYKSTYMPLMPRTVCGTEVTVLRIYLQQKVAYCYVAIVVIFFFFFFCGGGGVGAGGCLWL